MKKIEVDEMGVLKEGEDEMGSRRSGMTTNKPDNVGV